MHIRRQNQSPYKKKPHKQHRKFAGPVRLHRVARMSRKVVVCLDRCCDDTQASGLLTVLDRWPAPLRALPSQSPPVRKTMPTDDFPTHRSQCNRWQYHRFKYNNLIKNVLSSLRYFYRQNYYSDKRLYSIKFNLAIVYLCLRSFFFAKVVCT